MQKISIKSWLILLVLSLVWGSSFILMKKGMLAFSSEQVAALRISFAGIFLFPFLLKHFKINLKSVWPGILGMGVFGNLIPAFLFTKAETGISSSMAGMLNALTPLFTVIIGWIAFRSKSNWKQIAGIIIGFAGALLLLQAGNTGNENNPIAFALMVVAATLCYAISVNMIKHYLNDINPVQASAWSFFFIGIPAFIYLLSTDFIMVLSNHPHAAESLGYVSVLGIVGSALSVIVFNVLIKEAGPVFASTCTYLIPIVAVFWGLLDGEVLQSSHFVGIIVILGGIWLVNKR